MSSFLRSYFYKKSNFSVVDFLSVLALTSNKGFAHCDSYDGPLIKDAYKALETNKVQLVLKWIHKKLEDQTISLFEKTYNPKSGEESKSANTDDLADSPKNIPHYLFNNTNKNLRVLIVKTPKPTESQNKEALKGIFK